MTEAALDRLLAILVAAVLATGILTWRAGSADTQWLYALHDVLSGVLLVATLIKLRRSLPKAIRARRWPELLVAVPLSVVSLAALLIGASWVVGGQYVVLGWWTVLGWHAALGWVLLALVVVHLLVRRRWRILSPRVVARSGRPVSRRSVLVGGALAFAGVALWGLSGFVDSLAARPRRFTGSRWLPDGGFPPQTTFFGEGIPTINIADWRLRVGGHVERPFELSLDDLRSIGAVEREAVLDCTGGWALRTTWSGVPV